jgi:hypothetical protein
VKYEKHLKKYQRISVMKKRYRIDKSNRLLIRQGKIEVGLNGKFSIEDKNKLTYTINELKSLREEYNLPEKINLDGVWSLNENHDLIFTLNKTKKQYGGEELYLKTELLDTRFDALIFSLGTTEVSGKQIIRLLQLRGKWQADRYNRLNFLVKRSGSLYDTLTFEGTWEVNGNNTLVYTYAKTYLKKKERLEKTLTFKGFWQFSEKNRLSYLLDLANDSSFSFKVALETPSVMAKEGEIKYRVAIGAAGTRLFKTRLITLSGLWKVSRDFGFSFEIDYGKNVQEIGFGAQVRLAKENEIEFTLTSREGDDMGFGVTFTRTFLKNNAQWFVRLNKRNDELDLQGGVKMEW